MNSFQLEMSSDKLMESVLNLTLFGTEYLFGKLREPVNKTDWITHGRPAIVNAFYSSIENSIRTYKLLLFIPFLKLDWPVGAVGSWWSDV